MAEPADDVKADPIQDALTEGDQDTTKPAPSTDEPKKPQADDTKTKAAPVEEPAKTEESTETETDSEPKEESKDKPEDEPKATDETETDKPSKGEQRKEQLNSEIRDLVARRNVLKDEVKRANAEVYAPRTQSELLDTINPETGENYTSVEAKVQAMDEATQMRDYNDQVADAQLTIESESQKVLQDFPAFNPDSEQYDDGLAKEAAELLASNLIYDPHTKQVIGSNVSPYQLYKTLARASQSSEAKGKIDGQKSVEKMLANADSQANASPLKEEKDPVLEILSSDD